MSVLLVSNADCCCGRVCSNCSTNSPSSIEITISGFAENGNCTGCADINGLWVLERRAAESEDPGCCIWEAFVDDMIPECFGGGPSSGVQVLFVFCNGAPPSIQVSSYGGFGGNLADYFYPTEESDCSLYAGNFNADPGFFYCDSNSVTFDVTIVV